LGRSCHQAVQLASDFTMDCIRRTMGQTRDDKYGVCFEAALPELIAKVRGEFV
jgi:hypothetical protein